MPLSVSRSINTSAAVGMLPLAVVGGRLNGTSTGRARMFLIVRCVVTSFLQSMQVNRLGGWIKPLAYERRQGVR